MTLQFEMEKPRQVKKKKKKAWGGEEGSGEMPGCKAVIMRAITNPAIGSKYDLNGWKEIWTESRNHESEK